MRWCHRGVSGVRCVNKPMEGLAAALRLLARQPGPSYVHTLPDLYDAGETQCQVLLDALKRAKRWICGIVSLEINPPLCCSSTLTCHTRL